MKLPFAPPAYDPEDQQRTRSLSEQADNQNLKRGRDIELSSERLILSSPNGSRWALTVSDAGVPSFEPA